MAGVLRQYVKPDAEPRAEAATEPQHGYTLTEVSGGDRAINRQWLLSG